MNKSIENKVNGSYQLTVNSADLSDEEEGMEEVEMSSKLRLRNRLRTLSNILKNLKIRRRYKV